MIYAVLVYYNLEHNTNTSIHTISITLIPCMYGPLENDYFLRTNLLCHFTSVKPSISRPAFIMTTFTPLLYTIFYQRRVDIISISWLEYIYGSNRPLEGNLIFAGITFHRNTHERRTEFTTSSWRKDECHSCDDNCSWLDWQRSFVFVAHFSSFISSDVNAIEFALPVAFHHVMARFFSSLKFISCCNIESTACKLHTH